MTAKWAEDLKRQVRTLPEEIREAAIATIEDLAAEGVSSPRSLRKLLLDSGAKQELRSKGIWLLGAIKAESFIGALTELIREETPVPLLWEVAKSLCGLGSGQASFRHLLISGKSPESRRVAAFALGCLHDESAVGPLMEIVSARHEPGYLRGQAAEALGYIGDRASVAGLLTASQDPNPDVRFWAVFALGEIGDPQARPVLENIAASDHEKVEGWWEVSKEAQEALKRLPDEQI